VGNHHGHFAFMNHSLWSDLYFLFTPTFDFTFFITYLTLCNIVIVLVQECVPVLLSDHAELPFQNVIDYAQVSIKWPSTRIGSEFLDYLASISDRDIEGMIARGRKIRCLFVYGPDSAPCSAVKGILWELQRKVRHFQQSTETFWLHNGSFVNRELVQFSSWRPPMPLP
jgi:hypothetical protein